LFVFLFTIVCIFVHHCLVNRNTNNGEQKYKQWWTKIQTMVSKNTNWWTKCYTVTKNWATWTPLRPQVISCSTSDSRRVTVKRRKRHRARHQYA
jgi:hypothetical protein